MSLISQEFFEKYKSKKLIKLNLENRQIILDAIAKTEDFDINDLFWKGSEILDFVNPKKRKRVEMKNATCLVEIKDGLINSFFEIINDDVKIYFYNGKRSDKKYGKRIFSDEELLKKDGTLGKLKKYKVYECNRFSVPTGNFEKEVKAKTYILAKQKIIKIRPLEKGLYYNVAE